MTMLETSAMKPIHILLVEDNEGDIFLTRDALEEAKIITELSVVRDGKAAIEFVAQQGDYSESKIPDLILLDINLPKKNGHEVLKFIKGSERLRRVPVIMLTTSSFKRDVDLAYDNHVNCYITKPVEAADFIKVITTIESFWIHLVKLPTKQLHK